MNLSDTPMFDYTAMEFQDRGVNVIAIMERPRYRVPGIDVESRWKVVESQFAKQQAAAKKKPRRPR